MFKHQHQQNTNSDLHNTAGGGGKKEPHSARKNIRFAPTHSQGRDDNRATISANIKRYFALYEPSSTITSCLRSREEKEEREEAITRRENDCERGCGKDGGKAVLCQHHHDHHHSCSSRPPPPWSKSEVARRMNSNTTANSRLVAFKRYGGGTVLVRFDDDPPRASAPPQQQLHGGGGDDSLHPSQTDDSGGSGCDGFVHQAGTNLAPTAVSGEEQQQSSAPTANFDFVDYENDAYIRVIQRKQQRMKERGQILGADGKPTTSKASNTVRSLIHKAQSSFPLSLWYRNKSSETLETFVFGDDELELERRRRMRLRLARREERRRRQQAEDALSERGGGVGPTPSPTSSLLRRRRHHLTAESARREPAKEHFARRTAAN